ncbi:hypothetical protein [Dyadobacter psychrophilus]|uniref:Uncharacterized protein n=1 Tax=Dyadobacter psychrophilus TaxID=651661 RepID=A0A1T5BYT7_9BACT|nr:hypothetical protein [Dyadobacter psychrophilus]SKB52040.1 hypothetical protein SAMN05660293_00702 [Dyadobacter psychrophilus]
MKQLILIFLVLSRHLNCFAVIRYVRVGGGGLQTGDSWANASGDLQLMINQSSSLVLDTIYVAEGTYVPSRPADDLNTLDATNRNNAFTFTRNIQVFGGFASSGNPTFIERNPVVYKTTLSGNIGEAGVLSDNVYHVVITVGTAITRDFLVDGFNIIDGFGDVGNGMYVNNVIIFETQGAGWCNLGGSPTIRNTVFTGNVIGLAVIGNTYFTGYGAAFFNDGALSF